MSPILRKARIAGDGQSPGSSPYDRGRADKTKVERNKHGCLTCRLRRKKCDQRELGEEPGPCHSCEEFRIECLGSGTKLPEWLKVEADALRKEIKAHIRAKPDYVLCFGEYYQETAFRPHFSIPRASNTSSSNDGNSDAELPVDLRGLQLDTSGSALPNVGTSMLSPYANWSPVDIAFPVAGSVEEQQQWLSQRPHIVEAARTLFPSPSDLAPLHPYFTGHDSATAAQLDEYIAYPPHDVNDPGAAGAGTVSGWVMGVQLGGAELEQGQGQLSPSSAEFSEGRSGSTFGSTSSLY